MADTLAEFVQFEIATMSRGIYFSANDTVLPWVTAFLKSVRHSNPEIQVFLIPFDFDCQRLRELQANFKFQIFDDAGFAELEDLGKRYELGLTPHGRYWFRRYAAFWGPLDTFAYFDARQLILNSLSCDLKRMSLKCAQNASR